MLADLFFNEEIDINDYNDANTPISYPSSMIKPPSCRNEYGFVGLENQGATCYLNSLLQAMYMTPELRAGLFSIDPNDLGVQFINDNNKPKEGEKPEPDEQMIQTVMDMGFTREGAYRSVEACGNAGIEQVLDYAFQHSGDSDFNNPLPHLQEDNKKKKKKPRLIPLELQHLFTKMQCLDCTSISTEDLTSKGFQWQGMDGRVQHDAHELNRLLIDALEKSLKNSTPTGGRLCQDLYQGSLGNQTECLNCHTVTQREEMYYDLLLQVINCEDLAKSFRSYLAPELLEGCNSYACDVCGTKQSAHRRVAIHSVPALLTISCQRFDIDRKTWQRVKVTSKNEFPLALDMSPFVEGREGNAISSSPLSNDSFEEAEKHIYLRNSMIWINESYERAKSEAKRLRSQYGESMPAEEIMQSLSDDEYRQLYDSLMPWNKEETNSATSLRYHLFAVIMHHGSAYSGHYSAYIRDCLSEGTWKAPSTSSSMSRKDNSVSSEQLPKGICHIIPRPGEILVLESSPLNIVLSIVHSSCDESNITPTRNNRQSAIVVNDNRPCIQIDKLFSTIKRNLGKTWAQLYQTEFGKLQDFIKLHEAFFEFNEKIKVVRLKDVRYRSVTKEIFAEEYSKIISEKQNSSPLPSSHDQIDEDEKLAMLLQEEEDSSPITTSSENTGGSWVSNTKRKSRKQRNKETAKALKKTLETATVTIGKSINEVESSPQQVVNDETIETPKDQKDETPSQPNANNSSEDSKEDLLAQLLLNEFHGKFFCFNDSEVRPIFLTDLCNAFEGKSSAYILIYRKFDMGDSSVFRQLSCRSSDFPGVDQSQLRNDGKYSQIMQLRYLNLQLGQQDSKAISDDKKTLIQPPTYWKQRVDLINSSLRTRRLEFDQMMKSLTLRIYLPEHFTSDWPCLLLKSDQLRLPAAWYHGIEVECDMSKTIGQLCSEIWSIMMEEAKRVNKTSDLGFLLGLPKPWESLELVFQLSEVLPCPKLSHETQQVSRYYIKSPPQENSLIKDHFVHHAKILFYCQGFQTLPPPSNAQFEVMETAPKELIITHAVDSLTLNLISVHIYLPQSIQLNSMCQYVCSFLGLSVQHSHIYLIQERKLTTTTRTTLNSQLSELKSSTSGKSKEYSVISLWKSGLLARGHQGLSFGQLEGSEIIVENLTSVKKSSPNSGIAHQEVTRRNRLRIIRVDLENTGSLVQLHRDFSLGGKNFPTLMKEEDGMSVVADSGDDQEPSVEDQESLFSSSIKVEIDFDASLFELKLKALSMLGFGSHVAERARLKTVGEGPILDENVSIKGASLSDNSSLSLELIPICDDQKKLSLKYCLVYGNDPHPKHNPSIPGQRTQEYHIEVSTSCTVRLLKSQLLQHYLANITPIDLNLEKAHAADVTTEKRIENLRIRLTNWAGECGELMEEVNDESKELYEYSLSEITFNPTYLILLEEGKYPVKGILHVKLWLWKPNLTPMECDEECISYPLNDEMSVLFHEMMTKNIKQYPTREIKRSNFLEIGVVDIHEDSLLSELHHAAFNELKVYELSDQRMVEYEINFPPSADFMILRQYRSDQLPGLLYSIYPPHQAITPDLSSIGQKNNKKKAIAERVAMKTIKKAGIEGNECGEVDLVIQILENSLEVTGSPSPGECILWSVNPIVKTRYSLGDDNSDLMEVISKFSWPPIQSYFKGNGAMPNFNHLKNHFSSVYNIPIDNILIFKYAISSAKWYQLSSGMKNPLKGKKKSSFYNSKTENILLPPYSLRDGDLLAIIDISSSSELIVSPLLLDYDDDKNQQETTSMNNNDRSVYTIQNDLHLDRYEDIYLRWLKNEENVEKKIKAKNMPGGKKKQIVEISLKFGGDLDFSSEEEEEGENDDS